MKSKIYGELLERRLTRKYSKPLMVGLLLWSIWLAGQVWVVAQMPTVIYHLN